MLNVSEGFKLRLFCSIDIVNSTAYKQPTNFNKPTNFTQPQHWVSLFDSFFAEFPFLFKREFSIKFREADVNKESIDDHSLIIWKFLGDEIIFTINVYAAEFVPIYIKALLTTINDYRKKVIRIRKKLDLKATLWLAGFPITNASLILRQNTNQTETDTQEIRDFIGPSMDIGFRLTKFSSPGRMVVSIELVNLLARVGPNFILDLKLYQNGSQFLKGVLGGTLYPIFWIVGDEEYTEKNKAKRDLIKKEKDISRVKLDDLEDYSSKFIKKHTPVLFRPFIIDDNNSNNMLAPTRSERAELEVKRQKIVDEYGRSTENMEKVAPDTEEQ